MQNTNINLIMAEDSDSLELGGSIELSGFSEIDSASLIIVKKVVGNFVKKVSEQNKKFEKLTLRMKGVHKTEKSEKYEIHCVVAIGGKNFTSEVTERNIFVGIDSVLRKVDKEIK